MRYKIVPLLLFAGTIASAADGDVFKELNKQESELKAKKAAAIHAIVVEVMGGKDISSAKEFQEYRAKVDKQVEKTSGLSLSAHPEMSRMVDHELGQMWQALKSNWDATVNLPSSSGVTGGDASAGAAVAPKAPAKTKEGDSTDPSPKPNTNDWTGRFGAGLGMTFDLGKHVRVKSAHLETRTASAAAGGNYKQVVVDEDGDVFARPIIEAHHYFTPDWFGTNLMGKWGHGPFIIAALGGDNIISAAGAGYMVGFRRKTVAGDYLPEHFNIGVAYTVDFGVKVLADGYETDQRLPVATTEVKFRNTHQEGISFVFSIGW